MSSILIKGVKMPKYKPICIIIDPVGQARRYDLNNDKYADDELFEAVPVPPHGRLIDADALKASLVFAEETAEWAVPALRVVLMIIDKMPTIIEAGEDEI